MMAPTLKRAVAGARYNGQREGVGAAAAGDQEQGRSAASAVEAVRSVRCLMLRLRSFSRAAAVAAGEKPMASAGVLRVHSAWWFLYIGVREGEGVRNSRR